MLEPNATMSRPAAGVLSVGDTVFVRNGGPGSGPYRPATVIKVGRVWLTVSQGGAGREQRFQLGGRQQDDSDSGYKSHFATREQMEYDQIFYEAMRFLQAQGISLDHSSPWRVAGGPIILAELLRANGGSDNRAYV